MRESEAIELLGLGLPDGNHLAMRDLAHRLGEWPLLLRIVNAVVREQVDLGSTKRAALEYVNQALTLAGLTAFDPDDALERQSAAGKTIEVSLNRLTPQDRGRFEELAIFPEDVDVPITTLGRYWQTTGDLSLAAVKHLCSHLERISLLLTYDAARSTIRLHDIVRTYLRHLRRTDLPTLNETLLHCHRNLAARDEYDRRSRWDSMPLDEPYLWGQLAYHLGEANLWDELRVTATSLIYLAKKSFVRNAAEAETELAVACERFPDDPILKLLRRQIAQAANVLSGFSRVSDLAATLHSRLEHLSSLAPHRAEFLPYLNPPYLASWHLLPDLPNPALVRTLVGHVDTVVACAISTDARTIVTASRDSTVRVWDGTTGNQLRILSHTTQVLDCDLNAAGTMVMSVTFDGAVWLWDLEEDDPVWVSAADFTRPLSCSISANSKTLAWIDGEHRLFVCSSVERSDPTLISTEANALGRCSLDAEGKELAWIGQDGFARTVSTSSGSETWRSSTEMPDVRGSALSANGVAFAAARGDRAIWVWQRKQPSEPELLTGCTNTINDCALSADGTVVAAACEDRAVHVWQTPHASRARVLDGHAFGILGCALDRTGKIVVTSSRDRTVKIWDISDDVPDYARTVENVRGRIRACAASKTNQEFVTVSENGVL